MTFVFSDFLSESLSVMVFYPIKSHIKFLEARITLLNYLFFFVLSSGNGSSSSYRLYKELKSFLLVLF